MTSPRSPRVLHLIPHLGIGGAELQLCQLISRTPEGAARHDVLYYADAQDEEARRLFESRGIPVRRVPRSRAAPIAFAARLATAIAEARPDIVHCWLVSACLWGRIAARRARAPRIVFSFRSSSIEHALVLRLARLLGDSGAYYLANSRAVAVAVARDVGAPANRITIIPNGVELPEPVLAPGDSPSSPTRAREGRRLVLSVGRMCVEKNYPMLLRVAARFPAASGVRFAVAGHGELEADLLRLREAMGLVDRVDFVGLRDDVPALLRTADLFAFTSNQEGAPNALLEAMAAGVPIVTTRFAGYDDIVTPDRDALVVDRDDVGAFEAAVRRLLENPPAARALGAAARRTVTERFSIPAMVQSTLQYYQRILAAPD